MNPGLLNERITLKTPTSSSLDRFGQTVVTYTTASLWASVKMVSGNENNANGLIVSNTTYTFITRHRDTTSEKCIVTYNSRNYNVVAVEEFYKGYDKLTTEKI